MLNAQIIAEIKSTVENKVQNEIENLPSPIEHSKLNGFFMEQHQAAMQEVSNRYH